MDNRWTNDGGSSEKQGRGKDNVDGQIPVNSCEYGNFCLPLLAELAKLKASVRKTN